MSSSYYATRRPATLAELARWERPCPVKYEHPAFRGKHNVVGIYDHGKMIGKRCVSCGARHDG